MRERVVDRNTRREIPGMSMVTTDAEDLEQGIPVATASGTNLTAAMKNGHAPRAPTTPALKGGEPRAPALDDSSVLPVPSHAVLHQLSTSSIRNGVLGVGTTTRYRDKVITWYSCLIASSLTLLSVSNDDLLQTYVKLDALCCTIKTASCLLYCLLLITTHRSYVVSPITPIARYIDA